MLLQFNLLRMQHHWIYASNVEAFFWFKPIAWMIVIVDHVDVFFWNQTEIEVRRLGCKNSHLLFIIFGIFSAHILHLSDMGMKKKLTYTKDTIICTTERKTDSVLLLQRENFIGIWTVVRSIQRNKALKKDDLI